MDAIDWKAEGDRCVALLQQLLRIPTVNRGTGEEGDGGETPAAELLAEFLREANVEPRLFQKKKGRACLVARVKGTGERPPILLNAHLDVVEADASGWEHPPFGGEIHDGYLWGRGTLDMKHMAAMSACVLSLLARGARGGRTKLDRDVIFAAVADEEAGCADGSIFLVDEHPDEIRAEYTLGEVGGFSLHLLGRTFYPIQVAEKGACWVRATFEGHPGHGSLPNPDSAVIRMASAIAKLGRTRLPTHASAPVASFLRELASKLPLPHRGALSLLAVPAVAGAILDTLVRDPEQRRTFGALLSNTATPTVVRAGSKVNVIPGSASVEIDGRILPGQTEATFLDELREVLGKDATLEVLRSLPPVETTPASPLFGHLARTIGRHAPDAVAIPFVIPGFTDAKAYARLGSTCYGFAPLRFDPGRKDIVFSRMFHGNNERVPVAGLRWGLEVLYDAVSSFTSASTSPSRRSG